MMLNIELVLQLELDDLDGVAGDGVREGGGGVGDGGRDRHDAGRGGDGVSGGHGGG